jgi:hypothetical protein
VRFEAGRLEEPAHFCASTQDFETSGVTEVFVLQYANMINSQLPHSLRLDADSLLSIHCGREEFSH